MAAKKFLQRVSLERARELLLELARPLETESVPAEQAYGRCAAAAVDARRPSPHYRASAMDGIAVRSEDTRAAATGPIRLRAIGADLRSPAPGSCLPIDTGGAVPDWADAVVRIEDVKAVGDQFELRAPVTSGRDVRPVGEDLESGVRLFARGHRIQPADIGALLATGHTEVEVIRRPRLGILATGTEVVEPDTEPAPGQVVEFNSRMLQAYALEWGAEPTYLGRVDDDPDALARALRGAVATQDAICVIAGSSAGRRDFTIQALERCGRLVVHGIDISPGRPTAIACVDERPVVGIPGYPVAAVVVYRELVSPLVARMLASAPARMASARAEVRRRLASRLGVEEFLRVCLAAGDGGRFVVTPLARGAGSIGTLIRADALLRIPATCEGYDPGTLVDVELLPNGSPPGRTVVVASASDPWSKRLEDRLRAEDPSIRFVHLGLSPHDALAALGRGEAHVLVFATDSTQETEPEIATHCEGEDRARTFALRGSDLGIPARILVSPHLGRFAAGARLFELLEREENAASASRS
jgi:putative molybdopterin biosynthesis protein